MKCQNEIHVWAIWSLSFGKLIAISVSKICALLVIPKDSTYKFTICLVSTCYN